jgi:hypothetical protein
MELFNAIEAGSMKTQIILPATVHEELMSHLLPADGDCEEAAFVFATTERDHDVVRFHFVEAEKLRPSDFAIRSADYLELTDSTRRRLIKRAHDLKTSIIEIHSHVGTPGAQFSYSDRSGLRETVPHMWWRLPQRPYAAIVVAAEGFDAAVWVDSPLSPVPLSELLAGDRILHPTNRTFGPL